MLIEQILKDKGNQVISVKAEDTLHAVAKLLDSKRIGAVVAMDGDTVIGVLSERDIIRRFARDGAVCMDMPVSESMTRDVVTVSPSTAIRDALALMTDRRIRHLPVLNNGKMVGFISIGDLVKARIAHKEAESEILQSYISGQI